MLKSLPPCDAAALIDAGHAMLIDVREADEYAARHIPGSLSMPLSLANGGVLACGHDCSLIFTCQTGRRTSSGTSGRASVAKPTRVPAAVIDLTM